MKGGSMGEIRYIIGKVERGKTIENVVDILQNSIPLSELKRRLYMVVGETGFLHHEITDRHIQILVNGEAKEYPLCPSCGMRHPESTDCAPHEMRHREQPNYDGKYPKDFNKPDEWEAWVQRMPVNLINGHWGDDMQQWFREMVELIRKEQP
jgi:hypothetical protein